MAYIKVVLLLTACWLIYFAHANGDHVNEYYSSQPEWQGRLQEKLLHDYNKVVPPTHEGPIGVNLGLTMTYFDFIDEANEIATVHAWIFHSWKDPRLHWHPEDYNDTTNMIMDAKDIWIPDIELFDSASVTKVLDANPLVSSTGNVLLVPSVQINFVCQMDLRFFPYDKQQCRLKFGSWHHHSETINLTASENIDLSSYKTAKDFRLNGLSVKRNGVKYPCCKEEYIDLTYTIDLERVSGAYSTKLVLPSVLAGFLVLATFLLPPASYEKITLCGILFLCLLLLLTYLHDIVPSSGDTILGEYLAFALFIDFFATILAVVSYNMNKPTRVPQRQPQFEMETEGDDNDLKFQMPKDRKKEWLRHLDSVCFVLFTIVFIAGLAIILSRRG